MSTEIVQTQLDSDSTLFTLQMPAQPKVEPDLEDARATEVRLVAFYHGHAGYRSIRNAFDLLNVLFDRGVTDPKVLALSLEATGHLSAKRTHPEDPPSDSSEAGASRES